MGRVASLCQPCDPEDIATHHSSSPDIERSISLHITMPAIQAMASSSAPRHLSVASRMAMRLASLAWIILLIRDAQADCYWPDGTENDSHQPCYAPDGGAIGLCCGPGDVCLSDGICMMSNGQRMDTAETDMDMSDTRAYYRGSCIYKDWRKGLNCPTVCIKGPGIPPHADVGMIPCPHSMASWYCADDNMTKANCSNGAFIVSMPKLASSFLTHGKEPSAFTTIGVSPSPSKVVVSSAATLSTILGNAAASIAPGNATGSTRVIATASGMPSAPPPAQSSEASPASAVPLAVGISIGGASMVVAAILGFFIWRHVRRERPARAESPPPPVTAGRESINPVLTGPLFRAGSLIRREHHNHFKDTTAGTGGSEADAFRAGGILNTLDCHGGQISSLGPDAMAMHDMRYAPSAGCGSHANGRQLPVQMPEIPYDGRRIPPYHGVSLPEHGGYAELPG